MNPPCSTWTIWYGPEVEGANGRGERTLFVRDATKLRKVMRNPEFPFGATRIWFCAPFCNWATLRNLVRNNRFREYCIELKQSSLREFLRGSFTFSYGFCPPAWVMKRKDIVLYLKIDAIQGLKLRPFDHIGYGKDYEQWVGPLSSLPRSQPLDYTKDVRVL